MGRVGAPVVVENVVLLVLAARDDLGGASGQLVLNLVDDRDNERSNELEDEDGQLLLQLLNNLGQNRDLGNGLRDVLEKLVMKLDDGHDLLEDVADVGGKLLGIPRRHAHVLHLGRLGVVLQVINLVLLIAQQAIGNLVEQVAEDAGVIVAALLQCSLKILNLALRHLIRHCSFVSSQRHRKDGGKTYLHQ